LGIVSALMLSSSVTDIAMAHLPGKWLSGIGGVNIAGSVLGLGIVAAFLVMGFPAISRRFEHQADWFAAKHMAKRNPEDPADGDELFEAGLPAALHVSKPQLHEAVSPQAAPGVPVLIPTITLDQYVAGQYLHAQAAGNPSPVPPAPRVTATCAAPGSAPPEPLAIGAETFISALDAIADLAHRSRDRRGWMHPSVNQRMSLLRALAADSAARKNFDRRMICTRLWLVALLLLTIGAAIGDAPPAPPQRHESTEIAPPHPSRPIAGAAATARAAGTFPSFLPRPSAMFKVAPAS
jgi:hypothetical protein